MSFKIPSIPPTTNKTIRFPNDLIERVEVPDSGKRLYLFGFCHRCSACRCGGSRRRKQIISLILFDVAFDAHPSFSAFKMWRLTHILHFKKFFYCKAKKQGV